MESTPMLLTAIVSPVLILAGLAMSGSPLAAAEPRPFVGGGELGAYRLAWSDEFDGTTLDTAKWSYRTDSKHWSTQSPANVSVADGKLRLALKKEALRGKEYTGGGVISKRTFQYGYYEARFKCPAGGGWHTSFWMMCHNGSGGTATDAARQEIDVCEQDSVDPTYYRVNLHTWQYGHRSLGSVRIDTPDVSADFHVWGCEFTPTRIRFYFDGRKVASMDATRLGHGPQNIWLTSIASPLGWTGEVDLKGLPGAAEFDYVRFFELPPQENAKK